MISNFSSTQTSPSLHPDGKLNVFFACDTIPTDMSKKKNKKKSKHGSTASSQKCTTYSRLDYLAVLPGLLMCALTLMILLMDVLTPGMSRDQYTIYPALYRTAHAMIVACGILFWILQLHRCDMQMLRPEPSCSRGHPLSQTLYLLCFGLLLLWILISSCINGFNDMTIHGVSFRNIGIFHLMAFFLFYMYLSSQIKRSSLRTALLMAFLAVADLVGLTTLYDQFIRSIPAFAQKKELSAIFFNGNHYGYFLVIAVLVGVGIFLSHPSHKLQVFGLISMLLNLAVLLLNHSLGCLLAVIITMLGFLIVLLFANRSAAQRLVFLFAFLAAFVVLGLILSSSLRNEFISLTHDLSRFSSKEDSDSIGHNRGLLWTFTWELISERPLFGFGCEGISDLLMAETGRANPHNELLNYAVSYGVPAAILYLLGMVFVFITWIQRHIWLNAVSLTAALGAFGYFLSSLVGVPMFYTEPFFFVMLGLSLSDSDHCSTCSK